jgi:hypothetical protein
MLLASVSEIREALGFEDMPDITDAITQALHTATEVLSSRLGTAFDKVTASDHYFVEKPSRQIGPLNSTEFRLGRGFVTITSMQRGKTFSALGTSDAVEYLNAVLPKPVLGVVLDPQTVYDQDFVRITYSAGFDESQNDPGTFDLSQVPGWLQELAKLQAMVLVAGSAPIKQAGLELDTKTLSMRFEAGVSGRIRYTPAALLAL